MTAWLLVLWVPVVIGVAWWWTGPRKTWLRGLDRRRFDRAWREHEAMHELRGKGVHPPER